MQIIEQMLARYPQEHRDHAMREVMQEIALAGLQRGGFFDTAAFYGGTCLRIFYGLPRFSEDLDFSLLTPQRQFSLEPYFRVLQEEFSAFGFEVEIAQRAKVQRGAIVSAFLKKGTSIYDLRVTGQSVLKIKFEVDTDPPEGFKTEERLLLQPYSFYVKCYCLPDLYAGKVHALLYRRWKNRVKGRDWYDFEWYVRSAVHLNVAHLSERATRSGDWHRNTMTVHECKNLLRERLQMLDLESARRDVAPFLKDQSVLNIWSKAYFEELVDRIG